jgi:hypothetical protein
MKDSFIQITGCEPDEADHWLELGNNNLETCIELYYNKEDIRVPDKVKTERLIGAPPVIFTSEIPSHIKFTGNIDKALKSCIKFKKLLILNIQIKNKNESNYWKDNEIITLIEDKYVFLHYYKTSKFVKELVTTYNIDIFPSIIIIDPFTNKILWKNTIADIKKEDLLVALYVNYQVDIKTLPELSIDFLLRDYEEEIIKKKYNINIQLQIGKEKIILETSKIYNMLQFSKQIAFLISNKFDDKDKFEVYYDFPNKQLLNDIKQDPIKKLKDLDYSKIRFIIRIID